MCWLSHWRCSSSHRLSRARPWLPLALPLASSPLARFLICPPTMPSAIILIFLFRAWLLRWSGGLRPTARLSLSSRSAPSIARRLRPSVLRLMTCLTLIFLEPARNVTWLAAELSNPKPERFSLRAYEGPWFISPAWLSTYFSDPFLQTNACDRMQLVFHLGTYRATQALKERARRRACYIQRAGCQRQSPQNFMPCIAKDPERPVLDDARDEPSSQLDESTMRLREPTDCAIAIGCIKFIKILLKCCLSLRFIKVFEEIRNFCFTSQVIDTWRSWQVLVHKDSWFIK